MWTARHVNAPIVAKVADEARRRNLPLWVLWPLPAGWTVTGVAWVGDDRSGAVATVLACTGPAPLQPGSADVLLIAEEPGVGLGNRFAGLEGTDPGRYLPGGSDQDGQHGEAKVKVAGHQTALWPVATGDDRCAYIGEGKGSWLIAVAWPAAAGYFLAEPVSLEDLTEWIPSELVYGAPSPYLLGTS
jgi:hypothetical protein